MGVSLYGVLRCGGIKDLRAVYEGSPGGWYSSEPQKELYL